MALNKNFKDSFMNDMDFGESKKNTKEQEQKTPFQDEIREAKKKQDREKPKSDKKEENVTENVPESDIFTGIQKKEKHEKKQKAYWLRSDLIDKLKDTAAEYNMKESEFLNILLERIFNP